MKLLIMGIVVASTLMLGGCDKARVSIDAIETAFEACSSNGGLEEV